MSNPYIISMMKHPDPEPVIAKTYIDIRVTMIGFGENDDIKEFVLDTLKPHPGDRDHVYPSGKERFFCHKELGSMVYGLVTGFAYFAFSEREIQIRLGGEHENSIGNDKWSDEKWLIEVSAPDGTSHRFQGPIETDELLSDYPKIFVEGCQVRAYTPKFVKYGFEMREMGVRNYKDYERMIEMGITNFDDYKRMITFNSNMNPMETNVAGGRDVE